MSAQPQPSVGVQDMLNELMQAKFEKMVLLEQVDALQKRIAELEENQKKPKNK